jgi:hypothetical protein
MNEQTVKDLEKFEERHTGEVVPVQQGQQDFLSVVERLASNPNIDAKIIELMLDRQERAADRDAQRLYNAAMVKVQGEIPSIIKNQRNNQTNSNYADLDAILRVVRPIMTKHGLAISFSEGHATADAPLADDHIRIVAKVMHEGGHTEIMEDDFPIDSAGIKGSVNKTGIHAKGSTFSYGRRYMTCKIFQISTGDDDDGNSAGSRCISEKQLSQIVDMIAATETDELKFLEFMKVGSLEAIPANHFNKAMAALQAKARAKK